MTYYAPGTERASRVRALFGRIASRYDFINDLQSLGLHRLWKRRVIRMADPQRGERILDVCCGTGDVAFGFSEKGFWTVGADFSNPMLQVAKRRAGDAPWPVFVQSDALQLCFGDSSFDAVTICYGLRNLADLNGGLGELLRVLKPGGRLLALDFGKPANRIIRALYFGYLRLIVPLFGCLFCRDASAYAYILESLRHYPGQDGVAALLRGLGCVDLATVNLAGGAMSIHFASKPLVTVP